MEGNPQIFWSLQFTTDPLFYSSRRARHAEGRQACAKACGASEPPDSGHGLGIACGKRTRPERGLELGRIPGKNFVATMSSQSYLYVLRR